MARTRNWNGSREPNEFKCAMNIQRACFSLHEKNLKSFYRDRYDINGSLLIESKENRFIRYIAFSSHFVRILKIHLRETCLKTYCQETSDGFKTTWNYFESSYVNRQSYLLSYFGQNRDSRQFQIVLNPLFILKYLISIYIWLIYKKNFKIDLQ